MRKTSKVSQIIRDTSITNIRFGTQLYVFIGYHIVYITFGLNFVIRDSISKQICQCLLQIIVTKLFLTSQQKLMFSMEFQAISISITCEHIFDGYFQKAKLILLRGALREKLIISLYLRTIVNDIGIHQAVTSILNQMCVTFYFFIEAIKHSTGDMSIN